MRHGQRTRDLRRAAIFGAILIVAAAGTATAQTTATESAPPSQVGDGPPLHFDAEGNLQSPEMIEREQIRTLLQALARDRDFAGLEARFAEARESQAVMADGVPLLDQFYRVVPEVVGDPPGFDKAGLQQFLEDWRQAFPDSPAPLTLLGDLEIDLAWESRGGGWATEVSEEGWEGFKEHLRRAEVHLAKATELEVQDPQTYANMIIVAMGMRYPRDVTLKFYEQGFALDPECPSLYAAITLQLLPRWGGQPGELVEFAGRMADRLEGEEGDAMYARFGRVAYNYDGSYGFATYHSFDRDRLARGFAALRKQYPQCAAKYFAQEAELAAALGHEEAFRAASSGLGGTWRAHYLGDADPEAVEAKYLWRGAQLLEAANLGDLEGVIRLLGEGADVNARNENGQTALNLAVQYDLSPMVEVLFENGADPNIPDTVGWTVLAIATYKDLPHMVSRLVEGGARPDEPRDERLPLLLAIGLGRPKLIRLLIELGANPNVTVPGMGTPLHHAVRHMQIESARELLSGGANPTVAVMDEAGSQAMPTPLEIAKSGGNADMIRLVEAFAPRVSPEDPSAAVQ